MREYTKKVPRPRCKPQVLCELAQSKRIWICHWRGILCPNLQVKCRTPIAGPRFPASLGNRNAWTFAQEPFLAEIWRAGANSRGPLWCELAQSKFTRIFHQNHGMQKSKGPSLWSRHKPSNILELTPGHTTYRKKPSVWPQCLGNDLSIHDWHTSHT